MEEELLAPSEISFTTPFKQAYRAPVGNGNGNDSYEDIQTYNCDDDDDLNFIQSTMQHLALSEKKGKNRRQEPATVSPNSVPELNSTFVMGVAESKENSFQEESPSFLNFGGAQPATSITPGLPQKLHSRSAHVSPSCPTANSGAVLLPTPHQTVTATPPSEGHSKRRSPTLEDYCAESDKLYARFPQQNLNVSGQNLHPQELNLSGQLLGALDYNMGVEKQSTSQSEFLAEEQKIYQEFCSQQQKQTTPLRELNISTENHAVVEDFDIEFLKQSTPQREVSASDISQDSCGDIQKRRNSTGINVTEYKQCTSEEFETKTMKEMSPSCEDSVRTNEFPRSPYSNENQKEKSQPRDLSDFHVNQNPGNQAINIGSLQRRSPDCLALDAFMKQETFVQFCGEAQKNVLLPPELNMFRENQVNQDFGKQEHCSPPLEDPTQKQWSPTHDLNVSVEKQVNQDFSMETQKQGSSPPPRQTLDQKRETPQKYFIETQQKSPPPEHNIGVEKQGSQDFNVETQKQCSSPPCGTPVQIQESPQKYFVETQQRSPPRELCVDVEQQGSKDVNVEIHKQVSPPPRDATMPKMETPQKCSVETGQVSPSRQHTVFEEKQMIQDFSIETQTQSSPATREVYALEQETLQPFHVETQIRRTSSQDFKISPQKQGSILEDVYVGTDKLIFPFKDFHISSQYSHAPLVDFNISSQKQRTPPRDINDLNQTQNPPPREINFLNQELDPPAGYGDAQKQSTPPRGFNSCAQNPGTPLLVDLGDSSQRYILQTQPSHNAVKGEYSHPGRQSHTRKESTPPQNSAASCTTPTSEPILIGMRTPHPALKRLQDDLLRQETLYEEQVEEKDEIIKQKELELATIYKKIDGLKSHNNESKSIKKYEAKIANYSSELEKLRASYAKSESKNVEIIKDRDQTYKDLQNVENAYNDLMGKYLRAKEVVGVYAETDSQLKSRDEEMLGKLDQREQKIELLKNQIQDMVEMTYQEYDTKLREKRHESENLKIRLMRMEMRVGTLENDLEQKTRENSQLHKLCDEIISGRVSE